MFSPVLNGIYLSVFQPSTPQNGNVSDVLLACENQSYSSSSESSITSSKTTASCNVDNCKLLSHLKDQTLQFVTAQVHGNGKAYRMSIFSKMIELLDDGFLSDVNGKKISYFFSSIYTESYQLHKSDDWSPAQKRNMQNKIKKATNAAKDILLDSLQQLEAYKTGSSNYAVPLGPDFVEDVDEDGNVNEDGGDRSIAESGSDHEEQNSIDELVDCLKKKGITVKDIELLRTCHVRMLTAKEMHGYDENVFDNQNKQHEQHYLSRKPANIAGDCSSIESPQMISHAVFVTPSDEFSSVGNIFEPDEGEREVGYKSDSRRRPFNDMEEDGRRSPAYSSDGSNKSMEDSFEQPIPDARRQSKRTRTWTKGKMSLEKSAVGGRRTSAYSSDGSSKSIEDSSEEQPIRDARLQSKRTRSRTKAKRYSGKPPLSSCGSAQADRSSRPAEASEFTVLLSLFYSLPSPIIKIYDYAKYYVFEMDMMFNRTNYERIGTALRGVSSSSLQGETLINYRSKGCKGRTISTVNLKGGGMKVVQAVVDTIISVLVSFLIVPADCFPCGGSGKAHTIDLITSLPGAKQQEFHTDYDSTDFHPAENKDFEGVRSASVLVNFFDEPQFILCRDAPFRLLLPRMSFIVMRGDFVHAGDANVSSKKMSRMFFYLDPHEGYRAQVANQVYLNKQ